MSRIYFLLNDEGDPQTPTRGHSNDAGWDLYTSRPATVMPMSFADIHTDIAVALPGGTWGLITGRSSTVRKHNLRVEAGVIDPGYRGEMMVGVWNLGQEPFHVPIGMRLAQFIIHRQEPVSWHEVDELPNGTRGLSGFGSTGT